MKQIKLLFLLASASVTGAFAQSNGLTDMSQSRYAKMANTGIDAEYVEYMEHAGSFSWFP